MEDAVEWKWLPLWPCFSPGSLHVRFMVDKVALRQVFCSVPGIPLVLHVHSFIFWGWHTWLISGDRTQSHEPQGFVGGRGWRGLGKKTSPTPSNLQHGGCQLANTETINVMWSCKNKNYQNSPKTYTCFHIYMGYMLSLPWMKSPIWVQKQMQECHYLTIPFCQLSVKVQVLFHMRLFEWGHHVLRNVQLCWKGSWLYPEDEGTIFLKNICIHQHDVITPKTTQ